MKSPNITRGPGGVVSDYNEGDWVRAIRHGVNPKGHALLIMPGQDYNRLNDADFAALVAYVRNLPPIAGESAVGGGSVPAHGLATVLIALEGPASRLAAALRRGDPPVIARIENDACCLDPRTVLRGEDETLIDAVEVAARLFTLRRPPARFRATPER